MKDTKASSPRLGITSTHLDTTIVKNGRSHTPSFQNNYYILPENSIISGLNIDFILSQSKFGQFQVASKIQGVLDVPILSLEHTLPIPSWPERAVRIIQKYDW